MNTSISVLLKRKGSKVYSVPLHMTATEAVKEMNRHKVGSVLVMEGDRLVGIFTERDVLARVVAADLDPQTTPLGLYAYSSRQRKGRRLLPGLRPSKTLQPLRTREQEPKNRFMKERPSRTRRRNWENFSLTGPCFPSSRSSWP